MAVPRTGGEEGGGAAFRAAGFGVTRMAALPVAHPAAARTLGDLGDGPDALGPYLLELVKDPAVREALKVSSASLADTLAKVENGVPVGEAKLRRAALAVTRYILRMTGRPTPFGLLAGVRTARLGGDTAAVRTGSAHRKHARPDAAWLDEIAGRLHHDDAARDVLLVVANDLCAVRGDRLVLPYVRPARGAAPPGASAPASQVPHEMTVGLSPVVRAAVEAARRPLPFAALRRAVQERFPEAADADVDRLLTGLVDREVLLTDVAARQDRPDLLAHVNSRLADVASPTAAGLRRVGELLAAYADSAPGAGREAWHAAVAAMRETHAAATGTRTGEGRPPVHVDLRVDADVRLPDAVTDEVTRAAEVLWRLAPDEGQYPHLTEYHRAFLDRYGTDHPVPLREVLDPHRGLGAPAGFKVPASDRSAGGAPAVPYPAERDEALGQALHEVLAAGPGGGSGGRAELVLDDALIARLSPGGGAEPLPSGSLDLCVQPLARSVRALESGDFRLVVSNGSYSAGAMAGRFAHTLGAPAERDLAELYAEAAENQAGPLPVQLFFQPLHARSGNVARVPRLTRHAVAVGCFPGDAREGETDLALDDLAVGADGDRLFLVHAATGREVSVLRPHMLNIATEAPNAARFLAGIGTSGLKPWAPWQWSRLDVLPYLPRVRHGRTVLSLARWRPPAELRDAGLDEKEWRAALERWRERFAVPDLLRVTVLDHHLDLDLTAPAHQRLLHAQFTGHAVPHVQESPLADPGALGWSDGYATEVVVPLTPTRPRPAAPRSPAPAAPRVRHAPGGEWLYAKVYAARDRLDPLLAKDLPRLLARVGPDVDRWFFLRYLDPGAHLRVRFHGDPRALRERVLPALHEWAESAADEGAIRKLVLDTYEPETDRYGGPHTLAAAERLFHADSALVAAQLAARARGRLAMPPDTLAALNHAALLSSLGDWDWWRWVLDAYPIELTNALPPAQRRAAVRLADTPDATAGTGELAACRDGLSRAARAYGEALGIGAGGAPSTERGSSVAGVLHMHANRLLGMDPGAERRAYGLLRGIVRTHLGRAEHA
ncbi:lantibiotic dehydratase [Streptomyces albiaxialis]|uniref:Lantibiotic dehydratase n=1 Tax=Streptomyces albiaxialis TaxID=329523 RepID=A0ABN2WL31_9ACTN